MDAHKVLDRKEWIMEATIAVRNKGYKRIKATIKPEDIKGLRQQSNRK